MSYSESLPLSPRNRSMRRKQLAAESELLEEPESNEEVQRWIQKDDSTEPSSRFDWRHRSSSRPRPLYGSRPATKIYMRRSFPPDPHATSEGPNALNNYKEQFLELIKLEEDEDEAALKERLSTWTLSRLQTEGYCITELKAYWLEAKQFGKPVACFQFGPGLPLSDNLFESGTVVLLSRGEHGPLSAEHMSIRGSVLAKTRFQIRVCFPEQFGDLGEGLWRIDLGRPSIIFDRMRAAISYLKHDVAELERSAGPSINSEHILVGTHLRDVILRTYDPNSSSPHQHVALQDPGDVNYLPHETLEHDSQLNARDADWGAFKDDMRIHSWARRYSMPNPLTVEGDPVLRGLNPSQLKAMAMMIGQRISLVQGPPGTGKTKTIIETIKLLKVHFEVPHTILVATYTNVAVDNLAEGFVKAGLKPLRVSFGGNVKPALLEYSLDYKMQQHPQARELAELTEKQDRINSEVNEISKEMKRLERQLEKAAPPKRPEIENRIGGRRDRIIALERQERVMKNKFYSLKQKMMKDVIDDADVICTTCVTSACMALNVADFPVVFLDEASMSTEPASLIPITKGSRHLALIGDHKQLPPVITSEDARAGGLGISLFERLTEEGVVPSVMLDVQYRMHPDISNFPSMEFYNFALINGTVDEDGMVPSRLLPPSSTHLPVKENGKRPSVIFLDHNGSESKRNRSKVNVSEAHIVISIVEDLLLNNPELRGADIGVIAPYVAQIALFTRLFSADPKYQSRFKEVLGDHRAMQLANIEIKTVDGFEGREKEVIIFSTVRNNSGGYIGFLSDRRRLNVGLTRAKRGLFVVGNINTLRIGKMGVSVVKAGKGGASWQRYAKYLVENELVMSLNGDSLKKALYGNLISARNVNALQSMG